MYDSLEVNVPPVANIDFVGRHVDALHYELRPAWDTRRVRGYLSALKGQAVRPRQMRKVSNTRNRLTVIMFEYPRSRFIS